jgi:autotransporter-associated beta strand protein
MESLGTLAVFDITNAAAKLVLSGNMSGAGGLTKSGLGAMVLSNNVVTIGGTLSVQQGNLVFDNAYVTNTANVIDSIGNTPGNTATLTLQGSSLYYRTANALQLGSNATSKGVMVIMNNATYIGNAGLNVGLNGTGLVYMSGGVLNNNGTISVGSTGVGAVGAFYQTGGLINNMSGQQFYISRHDSGYGFYQMSGGTLTNNGYIQVGSDGVGLLYQDGGNISVLANGILVGNNGGTGVLYQTGGTIYSTPSTTIGWNGVAGSFGQYTIAGTATSVFASVILNRSAGVAGGIAIFNLNGNALLQAGSVQKGNTNTLAIVNFNGAALRASGNSSTFLQGLDYANVYGGGASIDSSNFNITIAQNLLAPDGQGITNIAWTAGNLGGYIGAPYVAISGGNGTGATAVALFDYTTGTVTGIVITSAGFSYTSPPTVTLIGGGNTNYVVGAADIGANASGGFAKLGVGILTLTGTNTYGGLTDIRAGALSIAGTFSLPGWDTTGRFAVSNGAALAVGNAVSDADVATILNTGNFAGGAGLGFDTTAGDRTYGNVISNTANGTLGLIKLGANTLILPGANTYSGGTLVISGLLTVANSAALGSSPVAVLAGAGLALSNSISLPNDITIAGTGPGANGALRSIDGVNTNGGLITLSAPSSIQTYSGSTLYLTNVINNGGYTLTIVSSGDTIISGPITNSGSLIKNNAGRLTLSGANTYSGNTTINNGTLTYGVDNAINSPSNVTVNANSAGATAVLDLNGYNGAVAGLTMGGSGGTASSVNKVLTGAGVLTLGGNVTVVATGNPTNLALISGKLDLGGADRTFNVADSTTAAVDLDLQAAITGSGVGFTKTGAGTMQLSASNSFTGVLTVLAGTLRATTSAFALGAGTIQLNGGTLYLANDANLAFNRAVTVASNATITADNITSSGNSRTFTFTTLSIGANTLTINRGANITGTGDGAITFSGLTTLTSNATFSVSTDGNRVLNLNGGVTNVGGAYGFTKSGGGLLVLAGAGTFAGDVTLSGGTLRGTVANAFGAGRIVSIAGSTLELRNANAATNRDVDVTTAGTLTLLLAVNSATKFNLNSIDVDPSLALTISVNRSSGTNTNITHTLNTVISTLGAATLNVTGGNGFSLVLDGPGNLNIGGALNFNATTADVEIKDPITDGAGSYGVTFGQGIANMKLSAVNLYNGNTVITKTNGLLQLGVADAIPYGSGNGNFSMSPVQGTATFDLNGFNQTLNGFSSSGAGNSIVTNSAATAVTLTIGDNDQGGAFAGSIGDNPSGSLSLTKIGAGLIALDGTNTFIGPTLINAGTLSINGALLNSAATANSGGTLGGTGFVNNLTIDGGALSPGNSAGTLVVGNLTLTNNPTLIFELGTASDLVIVTNQLSWTGLMETNWFVLRDAGLTQDTYTLFQFTTLDGSLGPGTNFTNIADTELYGWLSIEGNEIRLTVVPEPGSAALVAAGLALMLLLRHRGKSTR